MVAHDELDRELRVAVEQLADAVAQVQPERDGERDPHRADRLAQASTGHVPDPLRGVDELLGGARRERGSACIATSGRGM